MLMNFHKEMRNILLKTKEKWYKVSKCQKKLAELCSSVLWKVECVSYEFGYLAAEISKQNIEGESWILLAT